MNGGIGRTAERTRTRLAAMDELDGLNPEQRAAVEQTEGRSSSWPAPGRARRASSPTASRTSSAPASRRSARCSPSRSPTRPPRRCGTRVASLLGHDVRGLWISTFHALCAKLLRREGPAIGLGRDFVIYDSSDQQSAIKQALKDVNADDKLIPPRMALSRISQAKNQMQGPESLAGGASWNFRDQQIAKVFERYVALLKESGAVDFDDLLLKTVELFDKAEHVRKRYATQFQLHLDRRVPGHQPAAVPAGAAARVGAREPRGRRRPRPVDLQVARRGCEEHPRLRARLPERAASSGSSRTTARRR